MTTTAVSRPRWRDYVGQVDLKNRLDIHIKAALALGHRLDHVLLTGGSGMGKTTLAQLIADRLAVPFYATTEPLTTAGLLEVMWMHADTPRFVLFLDELHRWNRKQQDALLSLLEEGALDTDWGREPFPDVTVIGATTDANKVVGPLKQRFTIRPPYSAYTISDMTAIVMGIANRYSVPMDRGTARALAAAANGTPRMCKELVISARDLAATSADGQPPAASTILEFCGLTNLGLGQPHVDYLTALYHLGGKAGVEQLARRLDMPKDAVPEIEQLLIDHKMIRLSNNGRRLTALGRQHVTI